MDAIIPKKALTPKITENKAIKAKTAPTKLFFRTINLITNQPPLPAKNLKYIVIAVP
ncbi:hypothetical protein PSCICN_47900 [Pseudomonas cichorii]|nr:hypothetical protein PSCICN_47900 [Pseudomonas cichorii]